MKKGSTLFLKAVIVLIAIIVLAFLAFFPLVEGRNKELDVFSVYLSDPFLAYVYATSIPFFVSLYQGIYLLGLIDQNRAFSDASIKALGTIKLSALVFSLMFLGSMPYIFMIAQADDAPGIVLVGLVIIFASFVIATFAGVLQKLIQSGTALKSENDLTV